MLCVAVGGELVGGVAPAGEVSCDAVHTVDILAGWWLATATADGTVWLAGRGPDGEHPQALRLDPTVTGA
jgi:hypothetical protein